MSDIKLKLCPCCNGISILDEPNSEIRCLDCGLSMKIVNHTSLKTGWWKKAVDETIRKWNTRKPVEEMIKRLEDSTCYVEDGDGHAGHFVFTEDAIRIVDEEGNRNE